MNPTVLTNAFGSIYWGGVTVKPGATEDFPTERGPSHYYAARATDAVPVHANGGTEKFLFYRGLANMPVPLTAVVDANGKVRVESASTRFSRIVLFENRGGRVGYRIVNDVQGTATIDPPELTGKVEFLHWDLERMLIAEGLYAREAKAMVETWKDSWFEEGSRLFYLLPQSAVDAVLPLEITPKPAEVARAFVGRLEILTPAVLADAEQAFARNDFATLNKYGRFLEPIAGRLMSAAGSKLDPTRVNQALRTVAASRVPEAPCR
jgi:hypothetical protein